MKSFVRILLFTIVFHIPGMVMSDTVAMESVYTLADNVICEEALSLGCPNQPSVYSNFSEGGEAILSTTSCLTANPELSLRELWYKIDLTGALSYFLDGNGVNVGFEVYSGTCKNLSLVSCHPANENNTYISFNATADSPYFVRALGYDYNGGSNFQVILNCFNPQPACALSIDQIQIAPCTDIDGMVNIDLAGSAYGNPFTDFVTCEILTDAGLFFFDGVREDTTWEVEGEINGTEIEYIHVVCGNSESYCSDVVNTIALPLTSCESAGSGNLMGTIIWDANCTPRSGKVSFYQPGTAQLSARYDVIIQNNGHFVITDPPVGQFDILVKVDGCLAKGFEDINIAADANNLLECGLLHRGEVSNDNFVNDQYLV